MSGSVNLVSSGGGSVAIIPPNTASDYTLTAPASTGVIAQVLVGEVKAFITGTVPTGYLECDGASVSTTTYAGLYAIIGYTYGGSGASFTLPDFRGKFLRGWAHGSANDPDRAARTNRGDGTTGDYVGTNQVDGFKSHTHTTSTDIYRTGTGSTGLWTLTSTAGTPGVSQVSINASGGNESRPININVMYIIKY